MQIGEYTINENYLYIKEHEWVSVAKAEVKIGITDYAQKALREITYFYTGQKDVEVKQMETACRLESTKCVVEIMSPLSGVVLRFNRRLLDDPGIINSDPYGEGWIAVIRPTRLEKELGELLKPGQYADHLKELTKVNETLLIHRWKKGTEVGTE